MANTPGEDDEVIKVDFLPVLLVCLIGLVVFFLLLHIGGAIDIKGIIDRNTVSVAPLPR